MKKTRYPGVHMVAENRYRIRVKARNPKTGMINIVKRIVEARSPAEAAAMREAARQEIENADSAQAERIRLGPAASSWLASKLPALKASTRRLYADTLDLHIVPVLGEHYLDAISPEDVIRWRDSQKARPITVNGRLRILKRLVADLTYERSLRNPAERISALRVPHSRDRKGLEPAELRSVLAKVEQLHPEWYAITLTLALTGARWGEASALEWKHIDEERQVIVIERAHVRGVVGETKTGIVREVPLAPKLALVLASHRKALGERQLPPEAFKLVFPSRTGGLMQPSSLRKPLAHACREAKVRVISPHGLRHSFNHLARLVAANEVVQAMTGHVTDEMTTFHYDWVAPDTKRAAMDALVTRLDTAEVTKTDRGDQRGDHEVPDAQTAGADVAATGRYLN